jgi:hypothetical protein
MHYLNYRMRVAGYMQADLFSLSIAKRIRQATGGLPRSINLLADKLLMVAFSKGDARLKASHFKGLAPQSNKTRSRLTWGLVASFMVVAVVVVLWFADKTNSDIPTDTAEPVAWWQATQQLADAAAHFGVSSQRLAQLTDMDRETRRFLRTQSASKPLILVSAMPLRRFDNVYSNVLNGLDVANRAYLFAVVDAQSDPSDIQFRLLYDPRAEAGSVLRNKQIDLQTLSGAESRIVSVSSVAEMIARSPKERGVSAGS